MKHALCDHREPRDWRIWRAAPRWWWSCNCCKSSSTSIHVCCCGGIDLPQTLHVTFSASGQCNGFQGKTITLTYSATGDPLPYSGFTKAGWFGTTSDGTCTYDIVFACITVNCNFTLNVYDSGHPIQGSGGFGQTSLQCSPLSWTGKNTNWVQGTGCATCTGNTGISATVTE